MRIKRSPPTPAPLVSPTPPPAPTPPLPPAPIPRRRLSAKAWQETVSAFKAGRESPEDFAASHGISVTMLKRWIDRLSRRRRPGAQPQSSVGDAPHFIPLRIVPETQPHDGGVRWEVVLDGDTRIRVYDALDVAQVAFVIEAMRSPRRTR